MGFRFSDKLQPEVTFRSAPAPRALRQAPISTQGLRQSPTLSTPGRGMSENQKSPQLIGFMLVHHFSMIAFTAAIEPLRLANRATGRTLYEWRLYSDDGGAVEASNGVMV